MRSTSTNRPKKSQNTSPAAISRSLRSSHRAQRLSQRTSRTAASVGFCEESIIDHVSRFGEPDEATLPDDIREIYETSRTKLGFVPNVFRAYAKRPEHFRAFMHYHDVLMKGEGNLTRAEREAIVVAVSAENECQYCVTSHSAALRVLGKDPILADQIAINWQTANTSPRLDAILTFASRVNERGFAASDEEIEDLRDVGFSEDDIWDIAAIAAFFGFSNRMAGALDMRPNVEFYAMGRGTPSPR